MSVKPSVNEEEYFARQEAERRRRVAEELQAQSIAEERESARALHFMKCPKCGGSWKRWLSEMFALISASAVRVFG
jgi:hypothetical protein